MCCHCEEKDKSVIALLFILGLPPTGIGGLLKRAGHSPLEFSTISSVGHLTTSPLGFSTIRSAGHSPLEFSTVSSVGHLTTLPLGLSTISVGCSRMIF